MNTCMRINYLLNVDSKIVNSLLFSCTQTIDCSGQKTRPNKHQHPGVEIL